MVQHLGLELVPLAPCHRKNDKNVVPAYWKEILHLGDSECVAFRQEHLQHVTMQPRHRKLAVLLFSRLFSCAPSEPLSQS